MKSRFLGMKIGSRTRPDRPRPRKTRKTDRKSRKTARTLIRDGGAYCYKKEYKQIANKNGILKPSCWPLERDNLLRRANNSLARAAREGHGGRYVDKTRPPPHGLAPSLAAIPARGGVMHGEVGTSPWASDPAPEEMRRRAGARRLAMRDARP